MKQIPPPPANHACHINGCPLVGTISSGSGLDRAYCHFHFQAEPKKIPSITSVIIREFDLIRVAQRLTRLPTGQAIDETISTFISVQMKRPDLLTGLKTAHELARRIYKDVSTQMNIEMVAKRKDDTARGQQPEQWKTVAASVKSKSTMFDDVSMGFEGK